MPPRRMGNPSYSSPKAKFTARESITRTRCASQEARWARRLPAPASVLGPCNRPPDGPKCAHLHVQPRHGRRPGRPQAVDEPGPGAHRQPPLAAGRAADQVGLAVTVEIAHANVRPPYRRGPPGRRRWDRWQIGKMGMVQQSGRRGTIAEVVCAASPASATWVGTPRNRGSCVFDALVSCGEIVCRGAFLCRGARFCALRGVYALHSILHRNAGWLPGTRPRPFLNQAWLRAMSRLAPPTLQAVLARRPGPRA